MWLYALEGNIVFLDWIWQLVPAKLIKFLSFTLTFDF